MNEHEKSSAGSFADLMVKVMHVLQALKDPLIDRSLVDRWRKDKPGLRETIASALLDEAGGGDFSTTSAVAAGELPLTSMDGLWINMCRMVLDEHGVAIADEFLDSLPVPDTPFGWRESSILILVPSLPNRPTLEQLIYEASEGIGVGHFCPDDVFDAVPTLDAGYLFRIKNAQRFTTYQQQPASELLAGGVRPITFLELMMADVIFRRAVGRGLIGDEFILCAGSFCGGMDRTIAARRFEGALEVKSLLLQDVPETGGTVTPRLTN